MKWFFNKFAKILEFNISFFKNPKRLRILSQFFIVSFIVSYIVAYINNDYFSGAKSGYYKLDGVTIPSVESIVGDRKFKIIFKNSEELRYSYSKAKNPTDDINKYISCLTDEYGYIEMTTDDGYRVMKEDIDLNTVIVIDITVKEYGYEFFARKGAG